MIRLFARLVNGLSRSRHRLFTYTGHKIIIYYIINWPRVPPPSLFYILTEREPLRLYPSRGESARARVQVDNHGREFSLGRTDSMERVSTDLQRTNKREIPRRRERERFYYMEKSVVDKRERENYNSITHLSILWYYTHREELSFIRLDTTNNTIWTTVYIIRTHYYIIM